jgi:hypothetical protein
MYAFLADEDCVEATRYAELVVVRETATTENVIQSKSFFVICPDERQDENQSPDFILETHSRCFHQSCCTLLRYTLFNRVDAQYGVLWRIIASLLCGSLLGNGKLFSGQVRNANIGATIIISTRKSEKDWFFRASHQSNYRMYDYTVTVVLL